MVSMEERAERLSKYAHILSKNSQGKPKRVNPLFCRAEGRYLLLSKESLLCIDKIRILGFNKLNGDWVYSKDTKRISNLAIPKNYREVAELRNSDSYPISPNLNGVDGISQGLYLATCEMCDTLEVRNYLFLCEDSKCVIVDLQNQSLFEVYEID